MIGLEIIIIWALCVIGIFLSFMTFSGTWFLFIFAVIAMFQKASIEITALFLIICVLIEIFEFFAGKWGIEKRGGSKLAGWAAIAGAILGTFLIPIPIIGTLIGSFAFAYAVEYQRLKKVEHAAHIAFGSVIAKLVCTVMKIGATIAMAIIIISNINN